MLQCGGLRCAERHGILPQLELSIAIVQVERGDREAPHRDPAGERPGERGARRAPELHVEGAGVETHGTVRGGVVGVADRHRQPSRRIAAFAEPAADPLGHCPQQLMQHRTVVGVGGQHVRRAAFLLHRGQQHRAPVDPVGVLMEQSPGATERDPELLLAETGHLADQLEVVVIESLADRVGNVGKEHHRFGSEEARLVSRRHRPDQRAGLALDHRGGGLAHQLVDRDADRDREAESLAGLALEPAGDVDRRAEEPLGAGDVEVGVSPCLRLDHRSEA